MQGGISLEFIDTTEYMNDGLCLVMILGEGEVELGGISILSWDCDFGEIVLKNCVHKGEEQFFSRGISVTSVLEWRCLMKIRAPGNVHR